MFFEIIDIQFVVVNLDAQRFEIIFAVCIRPL